MLRSEDATFTRREAAILDSLAQQLGSLQSSPQGPSDQGLRLTIVHATLQSESVTFPATVATWERLASVAPSGSAHPYGASQQRHPRRSVVLHATHTAHVAVVALELLCQEMRRAEPHVVVTTSGKCRSSAVHWRSWLNGVEHAEQMPAGALPAVPSGDVSFSNVFPGELLVPLSAMRCEAGQKDSQRSMVDELLLL